MSNRRSTDRLMGRMMCTTLGAFPIADIRRIAPVSDGNFAHRSSARWLFAFLSVALFTSKPLAQSPAASRVARDQEAVRVVSNALAVLGGSTAFASIQDVETTGTCSKADSAATTATPQSQFKWTVDGEEYRYETIRGGTSDILASGHGHPANSTSVGTKQLSIFQSRPAFHLPGLVLYRELQDERYTFLSKGQKQLPQGMTTWVETAVMGVQKPSPLTIQDWYFSPDGFPVQVDYRLAAEGNIKHTLTVSVAFSNYASSIGTMQPGVITTTYAGGNGGVCIISASTANTQPAQSIYNLQSPVGAR